MDDREENRGEIEEEEDDYEEDESDDEVEYMEEPWRPAVESGDLSELQDLVQEHGLAVLSQNYMVFENGATTSLLEAASRQHMGMVRYLLEECSSVVDVNASTDDFEGERGCTSLHYATQANNLELVRYLVEKGSDVNAATSLFEKTPLHMAVDEEHVDIVKCLIDTGLCDLDLETSNDSYPPDATALWLAVDRCKSLEMVHYIMEYGPWSEEEKADRATKVLPIPCANGNLEMAKYLVESCHADVNAHGLEAYRYEGLTPLIVACEHGCLEIVQYLVEKCRADVEAYGVGNDYQEMNPLLQACQSGRLDVVQYLVEICAAHVKNAVHSACQSRKLDLIQYLMEKCRVEVEATDSYGNTALHTAAWYGTLDVVQYLVEKCGSDIEGKNADKWTALHMACRRCGADTIAVVKYFVDVRCVNVNVSTACGETALHIASQNKNDEIVQCLVQSGRVDINAIDNNGRTAMHSCLSDWGYSWNAALDTKKTLQIAKILATVDQTIFEVRDNDGRTVLHLACEKSSFQVVQNLVQECARVDVNAANNMGETGLLIASRKRRVEAVQCLSSLLQTDINAADRNGRTALHYACSHVTDEERVNDNGQYYPGCRAGDGSNSCYVMVQCLLETGRVSVNAQDNQGKTALHHSFVNPFEVVAPNDHSRREYIQDMSFKIVQSLVESGQVNVDATDHTGQTVLHYYCSFPNIDIPLYLIEQAHANVDVMDNEGRTALHRAANSASGTGIRSGLRLVLFLVSRLSGECVGCDNDAVERLAPILDGRDNDGHFEREGNLAKRQRT